MKHVAAYLLLGLAGNESPSAADIKTVLESVGIEADEERLSTIVSELKGKTLSEVRYNSELNKFCCKAQTANIDVSCS